MPRTFQATIALVVTLIVLAVLTILNVFQTNATETRLVELRKEVEKMSDTNDRIMSRLERGVAVDGSGGSGGSGDQGDDKYADALDDPDNLLEESTGSLVPADARYGEDLNRYLADTPKGFNWLTENAAEVSELQQYAHNYFARRDWEEPEKWVPELAYKIEVNDDKTEYTVHLREDVYWQRPRVDYSDPKYEWLEERRELTAEDAVFYFELVKDPQVQAGAIKSYYKDLEGAEVIDDHTFKVTWKRPVYQSLEYTLGVFPLPRWLFEKNEEGEEYPEESIGKEFNGHWAGRYPIGTGAYQIEEIETDSHITLEKNDEYWGEEPPIDEIEYEIIKDPQTAYTKLKGGDLDFTEVPPPSYKQDILDENPGSPFERDKLEHEVIDEVAYSYLGWNADKELFSDRRVRRAMTHALDRKGIIENVLHGLGKRIDGPFLPDHPATNPEIEGYEFDLDKAEELLTEAGWEDKNGDGIREKEIDGEVQNFEFKMLAIEKPTTRKYLNIYKEALRKIGIVMTPSYVGWSQMQKEMNERNFDAFTGGWALSWSTDPYQLWHSSQADEPKGSNRVGFRNDRADEIIEELRETFDEEKRIELLREFHEIVHKEQPYTFFYQARAAFAWNPRVKNVVFQQMRPQDLSIPWYIEPADEPDDIE